VRRKSSVPIGVSKEGQLDDNLAAGALRLTDDEVARLDEASPSAEYYPKWFNARLRDSAVDEAIAC
jgi:aryl-alcohol dehydrogenase-like predicted oxidoreductase